MGWKSKPVISSVLSDSTRSPISCTPSSRRRRRYACRRRRSGRVVADLGSGKPWRTGRPGGAIGRRSAKGDRAQVAQGACGVLRPQHEQQHEQRPARTLRAVAVLTCPVVAARSLCTCSSSCAGHSSFSQHSIYGLLERRWAALGGLPLQRADHKAARLGLQQTGIVPALSGAFAPLPNSIAAGRSCRTHSGVSIPVRQGSRRTHMRGSRRSNRSTAAAHHGCHPARLGLHVLLAL